MKNMAMFEKVQTCTIIDQHLNSEKKRSFGKNFLNELLPRLTERMKLFQTIIDSSNVIYLIQRRSEKCLDYLHAC